MRVTSSALIGFCVASIAQAIVIPSELSELTRLNHIDLGRLLSTTLPVRRQTSNETCPVSIGSFPGPTAPSAYDLEKRNEFVKRCAIFIAFLKVLADAK